MADKLDIRVYAEGGQTVSKFGVLQNGKVAFHNKAGAKLTVDFAAPLVLCKGGNPQSQIIVEPGHREQLNVCNAAEDTAFKYTATVEGAAAEDPIIIIEKSGWDPGSALTTVGTVVASAALGAYLMRRYLLKSKEQAQQG